MIQIRYLFLFACLLAYVSLNVEASPAWAYQRSAPIKTITIRLPVPQRKSQYNYQPVQPVPVHHAPPHVPVRSLVPVFHGGYKPYSREVFDNSHERYYW
ncbi:UNVERIFIED_CONTAM: hypothetical protein RMT77_017860 [Armadillidium vulgare]